MKGRIQKIIGIGAMILGLGGMTFPLKAIWETLPEEQYDFYKKRIQSDLTAEGLRDSYSYIYDTNGEHILNEQGYPFFGPPETLRGHRWCETVNLFLSDGNLTDLFFFFIWTGLTKGEREFPFLGACFQEHFGGMLCDHADTQLLEYVLVQTDSPELRWQQVLFFIDLHTAHLWQSSPPPNADQFSIKLRKFSWNPWGTAFQKGHLKEAQFLLENSYLFENGTFLYEGHLYQSANILEKLEETLCSKPSELRTQQLKFLTQTVPEIHRFLLSQVPQMRIDPVPYNATTQGIIRNLSYEFQKSLLQNLEHKEKLGLYSKNLIKRERERLSKLPPEWYEQGVSLIPLISDLHPFLCDTLANLQVESPEDEKKWRSDAYLSYNFWTQKIDLYRTFKLKEDLIPNGHKWIREIIQKVSQTKPDAITGDILGFLPRFDGSKPSLPLRILDLYKLWECLIIRASQSCDKVFLQALSSERPLFRENN